MKLKSIGLLFLAFVISIGAVAQESKKESKENKEESKVVIKVVKDGKAVLDSTFTLNGDIDHDAIKKMVKKYEGDDVTVDFFSTKSKTVKGHSSKKGHKSHEMHVVVGHEKGEECCEEECESHGETVDVSVDGEMVYVTTSGEEGEHVINIKKILDGKEGNSKMVIVKKSGDGEEVFDILMDDDASWTTKKGENIIVMNKSGIKGHDVKMMKEGNVMFIEGDAPHKKHNFEVITKKGGNVFVEGSEENVVLDLKNIQHGGDFVFFGDEVKEKQALTLEKKDNGDYRLEYNSDNTEPVVIEVFNSIGKRLYKKKVKNFYGRFLQVIELEDNESAFFTVKVTQEDKEIIGEFEFM